jgi:hypothetical protein
MALARKYINMHTDADYNWFGQEKKDHQGREQTGRKKKPEKYDTFHEAALQTMERVNEDEKEVLTMNQHIEKIKAVAKEQIRKLNEELSERIKSLSSIRDLEVDGLMKTVERLTTKIRKMRAPEGDQTLIAVPVQEKYEVRLNG